MVEWYSQKPPQSGTKIINGMDDGTFFCRRLRAVPLAAMALVVAAKM
jgi:hypothetical protein